MIAVAAGVLVVGFFLFGDTATSMFKSSAQGDSVSPQQNATERFTVQDRIVGTGAEATPGKTVSVHYVGVLEDGTQFDSSVARGTPFSFRLGAGEVIAGWDQGVAGMKVGGRRILIIPPELGYGSQARGPIPANATLIFEVELLGVE